jgi:hypothetical protein
VQALRKLLSWLFWPLRIFGYAADAWQLWTLREWILSVGGATLTAGLLWAAAALAQLPRLAVALIVGGMLLLTFWVFIVISEKRRSRRVASVSQPVPQRDAPGTTNIGRIDTAYFGQAPTTQADEQKEGVRPDSPGANPQADPSPEVSVQERWRERIGDWRSVIRDFDFYRESFASTDTYAQMKQYGLKPEVIDMFEAQRTLHVGNDARGDTAYKYTLLDEVARIENERVLNAPEPITNQASPSELKALCSHLADELEDEHRSYLNSEEMVKLWEQELKEQGLSKSEIDQQVARAEDENTIGTLNRYNKHLKGRLLNLYDVLGPQGWFGPVDRARFENLSDPYYMRNLAKRLREVCGKLPDS